MKTFNDYLQEIHSKDYHGTDDAMPDAFEAWLIEQQVDDLIEYAESFGKSLLLEAKEKTEIKEKEIEMHECPTTPQCEHYPSSNSWNSARSEQLKKWKEHFGI